MAATIINQASSGTSAVVLTPGDREAIVMCNTDANACYVLFENGTAAANNMSIVIPTMEAVKIPQEYVNGAFAAVWAADGSGYLHITTR
jgi:hypothetical protein